MTQENIYIQTDFIAVQHYQIGGFLLKYEIEKWFKFINWKPTEDELQGTLNFFTIEREPVRTQFEKLSWYATEEEQYKAIDYLTKNLLPCEYVLLIMADTFSLALYNDQEKYYIREGGKEKWENAAKTIVKIGWPKVDEIIVPLFMWLLDPNWPGSMLIYDFLLSLPKYILSAKMKKIIEEPQNYDTCTYEDLRLQIDDLCKEADIIL